MSRSALPTIRRSLGLALVCALLHAAAAAAASPPPRQALLSALAKAHTLSTQASRELTLATNPELWLTGRDAVAPSYGTTVFTDSLAALRALQKLRPSANGAIALIVSAGRGLAARAIEQAKGGPHNLLAAAGNALSAGDRLRAHGDATGAVRSYATAWKSAYAALDQIVAAAVTSIPPSVLSAAAENALGSKTIALAGPMIMHGQPPLTSDGKPELFFAGSEACPFCAVERWGMIAGLSQFGTFSNLSLMQSLTTDGPSVRTLTFYGSSYRSPYVAFVPVEAWSNVRHGFAFAHLQPLSASQRALLNRFDPSLTTPFIDVAGSFVKVDSTVDPNLIGGLSWTQIVGLLKNPNSIPAQAIAGPAEVLTAEVCEVTGNNPQSVCSSKVVKDYQAALPFLDGQGGGCPPPGSARDAADRASGHPVLRPETCRV